MFRIFPINDKKYQAECATLCNSDFKSDFFAYAMVNVENGELMGFSQFEITDSGGYISDLKPRANYFDFEAMFILGRSTMNFIDLCGKHTCYAADDAADERLLKAIGFSKNNGGRYFVDMTGFFDGHCSGHPVDLSAQETSDGKQ